MPESPALFDSLRHPMYRTRWLSFRGWLAVRIKRDAERLSWWVNP